MTSFNFRYKMTKVLIAFPVEFTSQILARDLIGSGELLFKILLVMNNDLIIFIFRVQS